MVAGGLRRCAAVVSGVLVAAGSVVVPSASAAPSLGELLPWPAPVFGGEKQLPDRQLSRTTADGWTLHVKKSDEKINLAPPLDGAATTGEAFGSLNASVWIDGQGSVDLTGAQFETGYQIGCGVDVSGGADVELAGTVGVAPHADAGIEGGPSVTVELPNVTGFEAGADATGTISGGVDGKAEASPTVSGHLAPGKVSTVALASMPVSQQHKRAAGGFTGAHLQVNGCAGPVTVRSYATIATESDTSTDSVSVYGTPQRIR